MPDSRVKKVTIGFAVFFLAVALYGLTVDMSDRFGQNLSLGLAIDGAVLLFWLLLVYWIYDKIHMRIGHYLLFIGLMLIHLAGDVWLYGITYAGMQFDMVSHFLSGVVFALIIYNFLKEENALKGKSLIFFTLICAMGLSAIHELIEFIGYHALGEGPGLLMYGVGDFGEYNDALTDMISAFLGAISGIIYSRLK